MSRWKPISAVLAAAATGSLVVIVVVFAVRVAERKAYYWDKAAISTTRALRNSEEIVLQYESAWKGPVEAKYTRPIKEVIASAENLLRTMPNGATKQVVLQIELESSKRILSEAEARK